MTKTKTIWVTIGPPGCGKTTWATKFCREYPNAVCVNLDGIRHAVYGSKRTFWDNPAPIRREVVDAVYQNMLRGFCIHQFRNIIVPNTNLRKVYWDEITEFAKEYGYKVRALVFDHVSWPALLDRNDVRPLEDRLEPKVVMQYYEEFMAPDAYWRSIEHERPDQ